MRWLAIAAIVWSSSVAIALDVDGPTMIGPYRFATFTATGEVGSTFLFDVAPMLDPDQIVESDSSVRFVGKPGRYVVTVTELIPGPDPSRPFDGLRKIRVRETVHIMDKDVGPGPGPGPEPVPVDPVDPTVVKSKKLSVRIWEKVNERTPEIGAIITDPSLRARLLDRGHDFEAVSVAGDIDERLGFAPFIQRVGKLPCVTIQSIEPGASHYSVVLSAFALPASAAELIQVIERHEAK